MIQSKSKQFRILAIAPSTRGFGFTVMEDQKILECGNKGTKGDKNLHSLSKIEKLMKLFQPNILVLKDVNAKGSHSAPRIKALHEKIVDLAAIRKCRVLSFSAKELRIKLLGNAKGTKQEMAEILAQQYTLELADKLPPKRRAWELKTGA